MLKSGDINTCKYIRLEQKSKRETSNMAKRLTFIDDINTREYIQFEQERTVRKDIINNNNHLQLHKTKLDNIWKF